MPAFILRLIVLLTLLALLGGCAHGRSIRAEHIPVASIYHPTYTDDANRFETRGPIEVDVETFGGDVIITTDQRNREVSVRISRRSVHGAGRYSEGRDALKTIKATAAMVGGVVGPRLEVRTTTDHPEPHFLRADVYIEVPEVEGLRIRTRNGRVLAQGVGGSIDIVTDHGDVRVLTNQPIRQPVTILNNRGDIDYRVRGESTGLIDCESIGGKVRHRVRHGHLIVDRGTKHDRLFARLNDGTNPVILRTVYGDIRVGVVHNPEQVTWIID